MSRSDLWRFLESLRNEDGVTVVLTTHLLDEAEKADRIAILHEGNLVALDTPSALKGTIGGDVLTVCTADSAGLARRHTWRNLPGSVRAKPDHRQPLRIAATRAVLLLDHLVPDGVLGHPCGGQRYGSAKGHHQTARHAGHLGQSGPGHSPEFG